MVFLSSLIFDLQSFMDIVHDFLRIRAIEIMGHDVPSDDVAVVIKNERVYQHATARFNYTTYDLQRGQDIVQGDGERRGLLIYRPDTLGAFPWCYGYLIGIYHADVLLPNGSSSRVDFLWVRWMVSEDEGPAPPGSNCLEKVRFAAGDATDCFGVVDPASVIRACHLIPAFHHGRTLEYMSASSIVGDRNGDWAHFYVNR